LSAASIDYEAERKFFIAVRLTSHTRSAYSGALNVLERWLERKDLALTDLTPGLAREFIRDLKAEKKKDLSGRAQPRTKKSVQSIVTACSSFFTHLERRFADVRNPFRGTWKACDPQTVQPISSRMSLPED
jgi:site-specific recombinase XerD